MKTALALLAILSIAVAQDPPPQDTPSFRQIRFELLIVQLAEARAIELLPDLREAGKCKAAQEKIVGMIGKQQAELVDWPILTTKSGQRAVVENIHELRYATEYAMPALHFNTPETTPELVPTPSAHANPKAEAKQPEKKKPAIEVAVLGGLPSSFENKALGVTLEVEPMINPDGFSIDLQILPQHVSLLGWHKVAVETEGKSRVTVEQPDIRVLKTSTNITVISGQPVLLGFHKLQEPAGKVEVFILTATVVKVEATKEGVGDPAKPARKQ